MGARTTSLACTLALVVGLAAFSPAGITPALAAGNFIQTYIDANGGCGGFSPLTFVLVGGGLQSPFGKAAADWTDDDLALLGATLDACTLSAHRTGNPYRLTEIKQDVAKLLLNIPQIVEQGRAANEARARQVAARREMAQSRLDKAVQEKQQVKADANAQVDQLAREAAAAELELRQAQAEANARVAQLVQKRDAANAAAQGLRDGSTLNRAPIEEPQGTSHGEPPASSRQLAQAPGTSETRAVLDESTSCASALARLDSNDRPAIVEIDRFVEKTMRQADRDQPPGILARMSNDGFAKVRVVALQFCRQNRGDTLRQAALNAYDGVRGMQRDLGSNR